MTKNNNGAHSDAHASHRMGLLLVTISAVAWSTAGLFTRLIPLDAWTTLFWRGVFGGLFVAGYIVWHYRRGTWAAIRSIGWPGWIVTLLSALGMTAFISSLKLTTVADVAVIYATLPFLTALLAWLWLRERTSLSTWMASVLAFAGVAVMLNSAGLNGNMLGNLLALIMTLATAAITVMVRRYRTIAMLPTACLSNLVVAIITLPLATPLAAAPVDMIYLVLFGFVQMTIGLTFFIIGSRLIPAAQTALIGALDTPLSPFWVWLVFLEIPSTNTVIGGTVVMIAVIGDIVVKNYARLRRPRAIRPTLKKASASS
ncbi:MAG: DMT family transporter [Gammaproteobacteria bacterium]|nr:DMT family transporter [Gammaproteobacteria bacterium]